MSAHTRPFVNSEQHVWSVALQTYVPMTQPGSTVGATIGAAVPSTATAVAVRDNAGNLAYPKLDASGNLLVAVTGAGSGGTSSVDGAGYTAGASAGTGVMAVVDDTGTSTVAEDKIGLARMTPYRGLHVNLRDASGVEIAPATGAKQDTGNTSVASIDTKMPPLGQALAAASTPVVLTAIQVATLTPPAAIAGFALEAGHLAAIDTNTAKIPAQGQALAAASTPVVLTAIQQAALTPPAAIVGFALEAGHLAAIDTSVAKIPSQGQALAAASVPVVLTAIQAAALTPPTNTGYALDATLSSLEADIEETHVVAGTTTPPLALEIIGGKTNDTTSQYQPLPLSASGAAVITSNVDLSTLLAFYQNTLVDLLRDVRMELRIANAVTSQGLNVQEDLDRLRTDPYYSVP